MEREDMDNIVAASEWKGYWESLIDENTALRARVARMEDLTVRIFNSGYHAGHNDTVESCYVDIQPSDMETYHAEEVAELISALEEK